MALVVDTKLSDARQAIEQTIGSFNDPKACSPAQRDVLDLYLRRTVDELDGLRNVLLRAPERVAQADATYAASSSWGQHSSTLGAARFAGELAMVLAEQAPSESHAATREVIYRIVHTLALAETVLATASPFVSGAQGGANPDQIHHLVDRARQNGDWKLVLHHINNYDDGQLFLRLCRSTHADKKFVPALVQQFIQRGASRFQQVLWARLGRLPEFAGG